MRRQRPVAFDVGLRDGKSDVVRAAVAIELDGIVSVPWPLECAEQGEQSVAANLL